MSTGDTICLAFLGFLVGMIIGPIIYHFLCKDVEEILKKEAIQKGFAEYNKITGKWQWKKRK